MGGISIEYIGLSRFSSGGFTTYSFTNLPCIFYERSRTERNLPCG